MDLAKKFVEDLPEVLTFQGGVDQNFVKTVEELEWELLPSSRQAKSRTLAASDSAVSDSRRKPIGRRSRNSPISRLPTLEVIRMIDGVKSVVELFPSVSMPSSRIPKSAFHTVGCAFSISSNRMTERYLLDSGDEILSASPTLSLDFARACARKY